MVMVMVMVMVMTMSIMVSHGSLATGRDWLSKIDSKSPPWTDNHDIAALDDDDDG